MSWNVPKFVVYVNPNSKKVRKQTRRSSFLHITNVDEVKLAVAPWGSSEKNCWGWEGVSITNVVYSH